MTYLYQDKSQKNVLCAGLCFIHGKNNKNYVVIKNAELFIKLNTIKDIINQSLLAIAMYVGKNLQQTKVIKYYAEIWNVQCSTGEISKKEDGGK